MESLILPLMLAAMAAFMFFSIRNQKKRAAAAAEMQNSLEAGSRVQLHAGLFGTVVEAEEGQNIKIEIAPGVVTEWNRLAIREVVSPEAPAIETIDDDRIAVDETDTVSLDKEQNEEK
ncbi:preprotein translocase subunit YajC [Gordonia hydrophobica]|uniref:Preprotein translocase subunit YajC n=1 Tax=Gordonia hydrophobica TaxID=40516 RepID=A0ABZ2U0C7_9ACTN|nr:preprotein translocase subunit YajC [Gordonia hydrophobica]MBM7367799.1 preprotein translocase subunit YajC [Gordonia hydrophobica]